MVIWIIGKSGVGKTNVGRLVYKQLKKKEKNTFFLDGDEVRKIWGKNLGHSLKGRRLNASYIFKLCKILDKQKKLINFLILNEHYNNIKNKMIIMAGGKGKRLLPLTKKVPKPMLRLNNKPILEHIIMNAKREGFSKIILSINHLGNVIKKYLKQKNSFGISIDSFALTLHSPSFSLISLKIFLSVMEGNNCPKYSVISLPPTFNLLL